MSEQILTKRKGTMCYHAAGNKNIHEGHRKRLRQRFDQVGLDGFSEHEILELILFQVIPRRDTNPLAHELINHFGNLAEVLDASKDELIQVPG